MFTVGMAVYDNPPIFYESTRAFFTAMSLQIHHPLVGEVVIVDNNPHKDNPLRNLPTKTDGLIRYVELPTPKGTAAPRNHVFTVAKYEYVACVDPHVMLYPNFFESIKEFYEAYGMDCPDVLHGPMMTERRGHLMATHMNDQWRAEMWGTWGRAWIPPRQNDRLFSVMNSQGNELVYLTLDPTGEQRPLRMDEISAMGLPLGLTWAGHESILMRNGCTEPNFEFPIPGHGMGFFSCRKDSWLPFHPKCEGFGGEEMTTGYRFRQAGRKAWCIPGAKWWHHFDRPMGGQIPYRLTAWDKIRNYYHELTALGMDVGIIREHFNIPEGEWSQLLQGVDWPKPSPGVVNYMPSREAAHERNRTVHQSLPKQKLESGEMKPKQPESKCGKANYSHENRLMSLYQASVHAPNSPINVDLPHLKHLAATCSPVNTGGEVVEIVHQSVSGIALLAGQPKKLLTFGAPNVSRVAQLKQLAGDRYDAIEGLPQNGQVPECDLLFLDVDPHSEWYYRQLLDQYASRSRRYIALHDTVIYGEQFNGGPGLLPAVHSFVADNPDWHIVGHHTKQNGLMVLSRFPEDENNVTAPDEEIVAPVPAQQPQAHQPIEIPKEGPGTELQEILKSLGVQEKPGCDCAAKAAQMNLWKSAGCRANMNTIIGWMKDGMERWGWADRLKAGANAVFTGLAFRVNPMDPFPGVIEEAIRRAEAKGL